MFAKFLFAKLKSNFGKITVSSATETSGLDKLSIDTIRTLSMDAVQQANSGHPGTPMALAPVVYQLWLRHLNFNPLHPEWPARDRFVLSCGHASMLLYSILHLAEVRKSAGSDELAITLEDIRNFRQLHSPCAGHPEYGMATGIETTTGPLGQGVANSVGMAMASRHLNAQFSSAQPGGLFDYNVYALCSDGDLMEGVAQEAASLAGHQKLANLCWIYDDNHITIEGHTDLAFSERTAEKFVALDWNVVIVNDANDLSAIDAALVAFRENHQRPTLIILKSIIGYGAPTKADSHDAHGAPLGEDEIAGAKQHYGWPHDKFFVPGEVRDHFAEFAARGQRQYEKWEQACAQLEKDDSEQSVQIKELLSGALPAGWDCDIPVFPADAKGMATRGSSGKVLNAIAPRLPWLWGGSADLAGSNKSNLSGESSFLPQNPAGRNLHFGVREHAMAAICNGLSLSHIRAYGATFFVFTDYMRPSMRLAALMKQNVFYILTHDSIGLGEDGPTHQPVEHLAACRAIPNLLVFRPGDANEVAECYRAILSQTERPSALVLTRQNVPTLDRSHFAAASGVQQGAYVLSDSENARVILLATGSELPIALAAADLLAAESIATRVVSMPCWELFDEQSPEYQASVLPSNITARVAVEAGIKQGWEKYLGPQGRFVGMGGFGESAPFEQLYQHFGITAEAVANAAKETLNG